MKVIFVTFVFAIFSIGIFSQNFPSPTGYVNDYVGVFTSEQKSLLTDMLDKYERETSIEIAVVVVDDLQGSYIESYATKLFNAWGIGKKGVDDGLLLMLSLDTADRGLRIEVGYGLEEFLTDYSSSEIIDEVMSLLKEANYSTALINASNLCIKKIGPRTAEMRKQYLVQLENERKEVGETMMQVFLTLLGIVITVLIFFGLYKLIRKRQLKKEQQNNFKKSVVWNIGDLKSKYDDVMISVSALAKQQFYGADVVLAKLQSYNKKINTEFLNRIQKKRIKYDAVVKISKEVTDLHTEMDNIVGVLLKNRNIDTKIRKLLQSQIDTAISNIQKQMPSARKLIAEINENNPVEIWRGFNYKNFDKDVDAQIDKANNAVRDAIKSLDSYDFDTAQKYSDSAAQFAQNAFTLVNSIFDVSNRIKDGQSSYKRYATSLPNMISKAESSVRREHVESLTKGIIDDIKENYKEFQKQVQKNNNLIDWILVGALVTSIISLCSDAERRSNSDINDYEEEIQRARRRREESSRSSYSSYGGGGSYDSGGGSSFGGFGGGMSGGGGSTGRF